MKQLREFAQRKPDFDKLNTQIVAISIDDQQHARKVWDEAAHRNLIVVSDPGAEVIRKYGLLHSKGHDDQDIALRTTIIIDEQGREVYRKVSSSVPDVRTADEILAILRQSGNARQRNPRVAGYSVWLAANSFTANSMNVDAARGRLRSFL